MPKDYYEILNIPKSATKEQIKEAYRKLVLKYHPDVNKDKTSEAKMRELNEAYAVLSDSDKRRQYDSFGPSGFNQKFSQEDIFRGFNIEDILKDLQQTMGFGFGADQFSDAASENVQSGVNLYLSFDDIEKGIDREFQVERQKICDNCKGSGGEPGSKQIKCSTCDGSGSQHVRQTMPFGVFNSIMPCRRCGGRGKLYEKICGTCDGRRMVVVRERFRIKAERSGGGEEKEKKSKGWFGVA